MTDNTANRLAVIDVGSNSVRLVVFDGASRSPAYFYNEKVLCGLGIEIAETGYLNPDGRVRAMQALRRFMALIGNMGLKSVTGVATAAVREASDGPDFCAAVLAQTGLALHVATGVEEARLSAQGVLLGWPDAEGLICDIGGASLELAELNNGQVGACVTSSLGPLKLQNFDGDIDNYISATINDLKEQIPKEAARLFLVGGSWRALARLDMARHDYPLKVLHEYQLSSEQMLETARWATAQTPEELAEHTDTSLARLKLVPLAARVMMHLILRLRPKNIAISSYGIREGMLFEDMSPATRALDPLIEACRYMEDTNARFPGFGDALFDWLMPLYAGQPPAFLRLMRAACLLHDVTWRAHPDYRADMSFEAVTRANMGGIDHQGRLFLALAIRSRYKSSGFKDHPALLLLDDETADAAMKLGKAMRLGAMLSGALARTLQQTKIAQENGVMTLTLSGAAAELAGEVVEKRLENLASAFGCVPEMMLD